MTVATLIAETNGLLLNVESGHVFNEEYYKNHTTRDEELVHSLSAQLRGSCPVCIKIALT